MCVSEATKVSYLTTLSSISQCVVGDAQCPGESHAKITRCIQSDDGCLENIPELGFFRKAIPL